MDPTANLEEQLRIAHRIRYCDDRANVDTGAHPAVCKCVDDAARLAELVLALDEWIRKRGFLPEPWGRASDGHWAKKGGRDT